MSTEDGCYNDGSIWVCALFLELFFFNISHLGETQTEEFSRESWITLIKKTQTALRRQLNMRTGRQAKSMQQRDILNTLYQLLSVSFDSCLFLSGAQTCWKGCLIFFPHIVENWLLLIRLSAVLAEPIWGLDIIFWEQQFRQTVSEWPDTREVWTFCT